MVLLLIFLVDYQRGWLVLLAPVVTFIPKQTKQESGLQGTTFRLNLVPIVDSTNDLQSCKRNFLFY